MPPRKTKDSAASPKKERATRAKKDPNAPKKPSGAYIFFCNDKRAEVKKANPEYGVAESGRELGAMWKAATDEDKQVCVVPRVVLTVLPETRSIQVATFSPALALMTITAYRNISSKQRRTRRGIPRRLQRKYPSFRQNFAMLVWCLLAGNLPCLHSMLNLLLLVQVQQQN